MPCKHFSSASLPNHQQFIYSCFAFGLLALRENVAACEKSGKDFASFLWLAWGAVINLSPRAKQVFEVVVQGLVQTFFFFNWVIFRFYVALQRCKYTSRYFETKFFSSQNIYTNRCICFLKLYAFGIYFLIVPMYFCVFHLFSLFIFCLSICFLAFFIDLFVFLQKIMELPNIFFILHYHNPTFETYRNIFMFFLNIPSHYYFIVSQFGDLGNSQLVSP